MPSRSGSTALTWAGTLAVAGTLGLAAWLRRWTTDDAFINYRIVDQIFAGNGPVFNGGERVEAATSPLWLAVLTLGNLVLPLPLEWVAIAISIPLAMVGISAMCIAATRLLADPARPDGTIWVPAGALVLVAVTVVWDFTTGGLETSMNLAWIGAVAIILARAVDDPEGLPTWALVVIGLGPLVRPDEAITTLAVLAFVVVGTWRTSRRTALRQVAVAMLLPVAFQLFRMGYYAALVPNTVLAKGGGTAHWSEGWGYLADFVGSYLLFVPAALILLAIAPQVRRLPRRRLVAIAVLPVAALVHVVVVIRVGGDYIHGRLLLPSLFALVAPVAMVPIRRNLAAVPVLALAVWAALCAGFLRPGVRQLDRLGSADALIARFQLRAPGFIGHEKPIPAPWLAARISSPGDRLPQPLLEDTGFAVAIYRSPPGQFETDTQLVREVLTCQALRDLEEATQSRLTPGRVISNLWHAPALTLLTVPPDPTQAAAELC